MQKIHCEIKGLTPYYFNKYMDVKPEKGEKAEKEYAMKMVYCDGEGLYFPGIQIQGCIKSSLWLTQTKIEKSVKRGMDYVSAGLKIPEMITFIPAMNIEDVELVNERVNIGHDQVRMGWRVRISKDWGAEFDLMFVDVLPEKNIEEALRNGGQFCGIGGRRNWQRGRFEVVKFE
ncbi:MAG: hypothetical protein KKD18_05495 [Nanoarchaeota archaeon]|nr:hypothetical protein [Nanoarchaeota archaeon]